MIAKLNLQTLLQSSVTHEPSEIILIWWFSAQETFVLLSVLKKVVLLNIFVERLLSKKNVTNALTVTFDFLYYYYYDYYYAI